MATIHIKGTSYTVDSNDSHAWVEGTEIRVELGDSWEATIEQLTSALLSNLGLVQVVWYHSRNVFKRTDLGVFLQPFFAKYLNCNKEGGNYVKQSEDCVFEGFEYGNYYPTFTINKALWEKAYPQMPQSYTKNIRKIL